MVNNSIEKDLKNKIREAIFNTHRIIIENTPVRTGRLRQSIVIEETSNGWVIGTNIPYSVYVELGVRPHRIEPRNKKALRFTINGEEVIVKNVWHPGFEGSHIFLKGIEYLKRELDNIIKKK